jgi:hypothetical protein
MVSWRRVRGKYHNDRPLQPVGFDSVGKLDNRPRGSRLASAFQRLALETKTLVKLRETNLATVVVGCPAFLNLLLGRTSLILVDRTWERRNGSRAHWPRSALRDDNAVDSRSRSTMSSLRAALFCVDFTLHRTWDVLLNEPFEVGPATLITSCDKRRTRQYWHPSEESPSRPNTNRRSLFQP